MTWFFIALLVAAGGIWTAYTRSKGDKAAGPPPPGKDASPPKDT